MDMDIEINNREELDLAIIELKKQKLEKKALLFSQFHEIQESIRPINILKHSLEKITAPGDIRSTLLKAAGGLGMGLLTKGLIGSRTTGAIGSMVGNTLKATVTNTLYNNADKLKAYGLAIYNNLFKKGRK